MWLCVRTYSSLFGEGIMRDERPTSTQNRMKGRARREGVHLQTAGGFSLPSPLLFCSPAPFSERFSSRVPHRTMRAYVFFVGIFLASVAPLGTERQPPPVTATTLAEAVPCSASRAVQDHTLLSSSLVPLRSQFCKLLVVTSCSPRQLPRSRLHHMSYVCVCVCVCVDCTDSGGLLFGEKVSSEHSVFQTFRLTEILLITSVMGRRNPGQYTHKQSNVDV